FFTVGRCLTRLVVEPPATLIEESGWWTGWARGQSGERPRVESRNGKKAYGVALRLADPHRMTHHAPPRQGPIALDSVVATPRRPALARPPTSLPAAEPSSGPAPGPRAPLAPRRRTGPARRSPWPPCPRDTGPLAPPRPRRQSGRPRSSSCFRR